MEKTGKVWLVGAGPGDPGLFTLKGRRVLEQADVVVYDALVGMGVMNMIPDGARLINVGKRSGNHTMSQWQINEVLVEEAKAGNRVVRLKGGDPFLFGRGGEELELLTENGIEFEVVPGVTSALSVPAYNGIPVTHRDCTSSIHVITGHRKRGSETDETEKPIDYEALVRTEGTLVFLMGRAALGSICAGLVKAGMDPDMPAAVLEKGTTAGQRRVVATVSTLEEEAAKQAIGMPSIIVVGKVCALSEKFFWYEKLPLAGKRILVTRPKDLSSKMAMKLREQGAEVLELPAIRTRAIDPNPQLEKGCLTMQQGGFDWIVFTSPTGVKVFMEQLLKEHDIRALACCKVACVGKGTAGALKEWGLKADFIPSLFDGETLGRELGQVCEKNARIFIPRAQIGGKELIEELTRAGMQVTEIATYTTEYVSSEVFDEKQLFEDGLIDFAVFTSASGVRGFAEAVGDMDYSLVNAVCIGKQTKAAADAKGMKTWMAKEASMDSVVEAVIEAAR